MELTYKVRGADGKEYGPIVLEELTGWLREARIDHQSEVMRSDMDYWVPAAHYTELQSTLTAIPPLARRTTASPSPRPTATDPATEAQMKSGASWFYWVAGLSLINSIVALTGSEWGFILGLGVTQIIDAIGQAVEGGGKAIILGLDLLVAGIFVGFGVFAHKRHTWAFIVGMILYALDGLIFLLAQDWLALGFHGFVLFCLFRGVKACRELNAA